MAQDAPEKLRIDKWLWFARVAKTRSAAAQLVLDGHVRLNAQRVEQPAKSVKPGDVLTVALERQVRLLRVVEVGKRRGPYAEARLLYVEIEPGRET